MTLTPDRPLTGPAAPPDSCLSQRADSKALLFDYRQAANPVRPGLSDPIPYCSWGAELHGSGPTAILPLDLSAALGIAGPATSPGLAAHFIRIEANEAIEANANATSSLFFVLSGRGRCRRQLHAGAEAPCIDWQQGDLFVLPAGEQPQLEADSTAVLYWVHDGPLLDYLGVQPNRARFEATSINELIAAMNGRYPGIQERLCDESGTLRRFLNIYVNGEDIRFKDNQTTALRDGDEVSIVLAVAGG